MPDHGDSILHVACNMHGIIIPCILPSGLDLDGLDLDGSMDKNLPY